MGLGSEAETPRSASVKKGAGIEIETYLEAFAGRPSPDTLALEFRENGLNRSSIISPQLHLKRSVSAILKAEARKLTRKANPTLEDLAQRRENYAIELRSLERSLQRPTYSFDSARERRLVRATLVKGVLIPTLDQCLAVAT